MQEINPKTRWFTQDGRLYEIRHRETVNEGTVKKLIWKDRILVQDYRGNTPYWRTLPLIDYFGDSIFEVEEGETRVYVPPKVVKEKKQKDQKTHLG